MSAPRYLWRQLSPDQREKLIQWRKVNEFPWHSPRHLPNFGKLQFLISAACFEHQHYIGSSPQRMDAFATALLNVTAQHATQTVAWCVLPNHYHVLVEAPNILKLLHELGRFHGRTSHAWNGEDKTRGRKVFYRATERFMRSERHFYATINPVHNNPVHHGYVDLWSAWPWSSALTCLKRLGREETNRVWNEYPVLDYGKSWDEADL